MEEHNKTESFACTNCGADLEYKPGTQYLSCKYCGTENEIPQTTGEIEELDFNAYLTTKAKDEEKITENFVKCNNCGATSTLDANIISSNCPYCATPLIIDDTKDESILKPKSLLPFKLNKDEAKNEFKKWISKLWFTPTKLNKATLNFDHFKGVYVPYWTYDTDTFSEYVGQRGDYYYETESYTTTNEDGESETRTEQVRKVRWTYVNGSVSTSFDDILIVATKSLPEKYIYELEPWDLENLVSFDKKYLSGYVSEKYQVELKEGFEIAKNIADNEIKDLVQNDIGGDEQRIGSIDTQYNNITFKHLLLPVYVSAYRYKDKLFQFVINARTGEVQGQRPYSWAKITLTIVAILAVIGTIIFFAQQ